MKKLVFIVLLITGGMVGFAQVPHLHEHTYPVIENENPEIRALMESVSIDSIEANISHLSSYHTRRFDSRYIYDVQDWLVAFYEHLGIDTVMLHDFKVDKPDYPEETADNVIAVQWGTKTPEEYVICGAHYDSWNSDGTDPDTIRSPGADDNASGVAGILETARILSNYTFDRTIIYANWNAEEIGLVGSAAYAADCAAQDMDIVGYFNLDMTGYLQEGTDIHVHLLYTTQDSIIANYVYNFSHVYFPEMFIHQNWLAWGDSDYSSFNRNGYAAVHPFEDVHASSPYIHSRQDILGLSVNNLEQSKRFTELNLGLVATLAGINNDGVKETEAIHVTLFPNPTKESAILFSDNELLNVSVYNLHGQQVKTMELSGTSQCTLNTSNLTPGIYVAKIRTEKGVCVRRLVVR